MLGILQADGKVDEVQTRLFVEQANPLPVTFHRAFDMTRDSTEALEAIVRAGAVRVLTSGQRHTAEEGLPTLQRLVKQAAGRIEIMAGAGVNIRNAGQLAKAGVDALHLSGSTRYDSLMQFRQPAVSMASSVPGEYERIEASEETIRTVVDHLGQAGT